MTTLDAAPTIDGQAPALDTGRDHRLDAIRGLAIVVMVLDHVLVQAVPGHWLRYTLTRASLPLFALVAGHLWRPGWRWRYAVVWLAAIPASIAGSLVNIAQPDVLVVILVGYVIVWAVHEFPAHWVLLVAVVSLAIAETGWQWDLAGYDPRWVGGLMLLGRVVDIAPLGEHLQRVRPLVVVGQWPLTVYVGHLVALVVAAWFLGFGRFAT